MGEPVGRWGTVSLESFGWTGGLKGVRCEKVTEREALSLYFHLCTDIFLRLHIYLFTCIHTHINIPTHTHAYTRLHTSIFGETFGKSFNTLFICDSSADLVSSDNESDRKFSV